MNKKSNYIAVLTLLTPAISKSIMNNFINREITNYNTTLSRRPLCDKVHTYSVHGFLKVLYSLAWKHPTALEGLLVQRQRCCQVTLAKV